MLEDKWSEIIAHFIGIFELRTEEARLRVEYDKFKALSKPDADPRDLPVIDIEIASPLEPGGFSPNVRYTPEPPEQVGLPPPVPGSPIALSAGLSPQLGAPGPLPVSDFDPLPRFGASLFGPGGDGDGSGDGGGGDGGGGGGRPLSPELPHPGSTATLALQINSLADQDILTLGEAGARFPGFKQLDARIDSLKEVAARLDGLADHELPPDEAGLATLAGDMAHATREIAEPDVPGAVTHVQRDAQGKYVDGEAVDELPSWQDLMPERVSGQASDGSEPADEVEADVTAGLASHEATDGESQGGGHVVNTGGNTLVNEVVLASAGTAAPLTAVMGDSHSLDVISQVNVWSDADTVFGPGNARQIAEHAANALNAADISERNPSPEATAGGSADWPVTWITARYEGNLVNLDWAQQLNFVSDHDIASVSFSGSETFIETGGNTAANGMSLARLGLSYDLIIADGDLSNVNMIRQKNVLLDDDAVDVGWGFGGTPTTHQNLLFNEAEIHKAASQTFVMTDALADAVAEMRSAEHGYKSAFLSDDLFKGFEALRVLHVEGGIYNLRYVEQTNVLGDADQVAVAARGVMSEAMADVTVATGANALINSASITDYSPSSAIYVAGEEYSDALIYQASLVDDAPLVAGDPSALASEAVVFLADNMLDEDDNDSLHRPGDHDAIAPDVMQTMLS